MDQSTVVIAIIIIFIAAIAIVALLVEQRSRHDIEVITLESHLATAKRSARESAQQAAARAREERVSQQVADALSRMALPPDIADRLVEAMAEEQRHDARSRQDMVQSFRSQIEGLNQRMDRLTAAYLDTTLSLEEFRTTKAQLLRQKQELKDKLSTVEQSADGWFEPALRFVKAANKPFFWHRTVSTSHVVNF